MTYRSFLLGTLPLVGLLGLGLGVTALTVLAAAGLAVLIQAFLLARRPLRRLGVHRDLYPNAFEDDTVAVPIVLENRARHPVHLVAISDSFGPGLASRTVVLEPGPLRGARRRRLTYRTACSRSWGLYMVGPLSVSTADPLGLFEARRVFPQIEPFAVFPRLYPVAGTERLGARPTPAPQPTTAGRAGQSLLYLGVRDYRSGDDLRRVHWPATARRGALTIKEHEVDLVPYLTLFVDLERAQRAGTGRKSTLEYVVRTASCLVGAAVERGDTVQVFGEGKEPVFVPPGRGTLHLAQCLWELIRVRQEGATSLLDLVEQHRLRIPEGSTAAIVFGTISVEDARLEDMLATLRSGSVNPLLVFINDHSFLPIDRRPLPREQARGRIGELESLLRRHGVAGCVLGAEEELDEELGRPDLFGEPA